MKEGDPKGKQPLRGFRNLEIKPLKKKIENHFRGGKEEQGKAKGTFLSCAQNIKRCTLPAGQKLQHIEEKRAEKKGYWVGNVQTEGNQTL